MALANQFSWVFKAEKSKSRMICLIDWFTGTVGFISAHWFWTSSKIGEPWSKFWRNSWRWFSVMTLKFVLFIRPVFLNQLTNSLLIKHHVWQILEKKYPFEYFPIIYVWTSQFVNFKHQSRISETVNSFGNTKDKTTS